MLRAYYSAVVFFLAVVLLWLANYWLASHWQQAISVKELTSDFTKEKKTQQLNVMDKSSPLLLVNHQMENITISDIALPTVPTSMRKSVVKEKAKPSINEPQRGRGLVNSGLTEQYLTSQVYKQLISDESIDIEIAWPDNTKERAAIFDYLYRCAGMQFGVMNKTKVTVIAKTTEHERSAWLRVAQGQLNSREIHWLQQASLPGVPVRLFPKEIDWLLAKKITNNLGGKTLRSFRGRYTLSHQGIMVSDVLINKQKVSGNWLIGSKC